MVAKVPQKPPKEKNFTVINKLKSSGVLEKDLNIKKKEKKGREEMEIFLPEEKFVYGVSTKTSIPIKNLISLLTRQLVRQPGGEEVH